MNHNQLPKTYPQYRLDNLSKVCRWQNVRIELYIAQYHQKKPQQFLCFLLRYQGMEKQVILLRECNYAFIDNI